MRKRWTATLAATVGVALAVFLSGCKSTEKPAPSSAATAAPALTVTASHFRGTTVSGPLAQATPLATSSAARVDVRVVAAVALPTDDFAPIGPQARLVLRDGDGDVVSPSGRLGYATRYRAIDPGVELDSLLGDRTNWTDVGAVSGLTMPATTFAAIVTPSTDATDLQRVSVQVYRADDQNRYELAIQRDEVAAQQTPAAPTRPVRETIVVSRDLAATGVTAERLLLTLPVSLAGSAFTGLVIEVKFDLAPGDLGPLADEAQRALAESLAREQAKIQTAPPADPALAAARDALINANESPRRPLTYLAQVTGAKIAETVALVADDALVALIVKDVRERLPQVKADDNASVGWLLEQSTIKAVASMKDTEDAQASLAPVQGVLQGIAGQAGVQLDVLESIAKESAGTADLYNRLVAEHLVFLEDSSPAVRVRAYDWLKARQKAPPEYDPLARPRERRAALEKFREKGTAVAPATQPR